MFSFIIRELCEGLLWTKTGKLLVSLLIYSILTMKQYSVFILCKIQNNGKNKHFLNLWKTFKCLPLLIVFYKNTLYLLFYIIAYLHLNK